MSFALVTDSACNLPEAIIDQYGIHILPLTFMSGEEEYVSYLKGEHTDLKKFYTMMRDGKVFTTSLPKMTLTRETFEDLLANGQDVLYLGFSSGLSGTYESVQDICKDLAAKYPERKVMTVDTLAASGGQGLLILFAAQQKEAGKSLEEVATWVEDHRLHLAHWFTVDDLMYLYRGGRVSRTSATAGTVLNIKPVLHVDDQGHLIPMNKTRGRKRSIKALLEHMIETFDESYGKQTICITHGDCLDDALTLQELVEKEFDGKIEEIIINYIDPVIGAHSGPGTLALFYLGTSRN